ncbi:MAG: hypothetical protein CVV42_09430 [Candidatus Riflebacteria bacterium HGW-Riflebacteria-2]|nr:MAG: hypothetical protein CVV42_09430 [Candidatus Riflebacteria bacterium HGW-Riflebacteria-2]
MLGAVLLRQRRGEKLQVIFTASEAKLPQTIIGFQKKPESADCADFPDSNRSVASMGLASELGLCLWHTLRRAEALLAMTNLKAVCDRTGL